MSANPPADGMFFVDQPPPAEPVDTSSVPAPVLAPAPVSAPAPAPEAPASAEQVAPEAGTVAGMRDVPLGTLIFRAGLLAEEQVEDALQEGVRTGKRLGEVLLERGWLHERDLGRLLAGQKGLPFIELGSVTPDPAAVRLLPEEKAKFQRALPIGFEDGVPVVAVADPSNSLVIENLRRLLNAEPRLVVAAYSELVRKIDHAYADLAPAPASQAMLDLQVAATPPVSAPAVPPVHAAVPPAVEPVAEQPAFPTVAPIPTVLPPVETRVTEEVEQLKPLVAEQPAPLAQPEQTFVQEQPVVETPASELPVVAQPEAPEPQPTTPVFEPVAAPAEAETAPVIAPLATPAEPEVAPPPTVEPVAFPASPQVSPEPVIEPPAAEVPTHVPEFSHVPVAEPAVEQPLVEQPVAEEPVTEEPVAVEPVLDAPVTPEPVAEEAATEPSTNSFPAEPATHFVVLRLSDGEHLEVGTFGSADEAQRFAQEVVKQIAVTEGESAWPFFAGRFLRPETIVSVDVIAESQERWMGSQIRARWAG